MDCPSNRGVVGGYQKAAGGRCPGDQSGKTAAMLAARRTQSYLPGLGMLGPARGGMRRECGAAAALLAVAVLASLVSPSGAAQELRYGTFRWEQTGPTRIKFFLDMAWTPNEDDPLTDILWCDSCALPNTPAPGDVVYIRSPAAENRTAWGEEKTRFMFGDDVFNGTRGNTGNNITGIMVNGIVPTRSTAVGAKDLLALYAEFEHDYGAVGMYTAALQGCCRGNEQQRNHLGIGWDISARVVVSGTWGMQQGMEPHERPSNDTLKSLYVPMLPEVAMKRGSEGEMYVKAFDMVERAAGGDHCTDASQDGCAVTYRFGTRNESGYNYSHNWGAWSENPAEITIEKHSGLIQVPAASASAVLLAQAGLMYNFVVLAFRGDYEAPDNQEAPYVTVDFSVVFNDHSGRSVPSLTAMALNGTEPMNYSLRNAWLPAVGDVSTGPYFDYVCEYESTYEVAYTTNNANIHSIHLANLTAHVPRHLLESLSTATWTKPYTDYFGRTVYHFKWSPPCNVVGAWPICWSLCEGGAPGTGLCSAPTCARVEVQGGCLQGFAAFSDDTPPGGSNFAGTVGVPFALNISTTSVADTSFRWINMSVVPGGVIDPSDERMMRPNDRKIYAQTDPGLPNGMSITDNMYASNFTQDALRTASWTPLPGQEGLMYKSCFTAMSASKPEMCRSESRCYTIGIERGAPTIQAKTIEVSPPRFHHERSVADGAELSTAPGCLVQIKVVVVRGPYNATLRPEGSVGVPPQAEIKLLRRGMTDATVPGKFLDEWELSWRPTRDFLQPIYPACLEIKDDMERISGGPPPVTDVRCVTFKMMRCRYCATEGQSLQHIAAYWWGADWIQIWGANSFIRNPNRMRPNELLTLGPTYIVKRGDTLQRLADRFGLSLARLELLNPHARGNPLAAGTDLCIMPEVCPGNEDTVVAPDRLSYHVGSQ